MGLFSFGSPKPHVSELEYRKHVKSLLKSRGFSKHDLGVVDIVFNEAMFEKSDRERGIDEYEIERGAQFLREHHSKYGFPEDRIDTLTEVLKEYVKKR